MQGRHDGNGVTRAGKQECVRDVQSRELNDEIWHLKL